MTIVFGFVLVLGACGDNDADSEDTGESESVASETEELVKDNCASCHGGDFEFVPGDTGFSEDELVEIINSQ